jgi:hypothetical protein
MVSCKDKIQVCIVSDPCFRFCKKYFNSSLVLLKSVAVVWLLLYDHTRPLQVDMVTFCILAIAN